jgi:hypothetical protein
MNGSPWQAASAFVEKFHSILREPKVQYTVYCNSPVEHILSQLNQAHTLTPYDLQAHFNIILGLRLHFSSQSLDAIATTLPKF